MVMNTDAILESLCLLMLQIETSFSVAIPALEKTRGIIVAITLLGV